MKGLMLSIFVLLATFAAVYGIKCYNCIGNEDNCAKDKLTSSNELSCPSMYDKCMRTWTEKSGVTAIVNSCSNEATCKAAEDGCSESGDCAIGCCDTDLCNAGSPVSFSVLLMAVCSALGLALLK